VQNHLNSNEIDRSLRKFQNIPSKAAATKQELICVSHGVYYLCGVFFPAFNFVFRKLLHKTPILALRKWKMHFLWDEMKIGLNGVTRHAKDHMQVQYGLVPTNYVMDMAESSIREPNFGTNKLI
jgi:hypothetical protein